MRPRSIHFVVSGALGGLVGFALMELTLSFASGNDSRLSSVFDQGFHFGGFGLAVGAALGMTEGVVRRQRGKLVYGLIVGLVLGALGGFAGGAVGQALYGVVPVRYASRSNSDIAIALDSSGSMRLGFLFGSDPWGRRKKAAGRLVDRLSTSDRVAVVDFDGEGRLLLPLTDLDSQEARQAAKNAIAQVDDVGGTSLNAGLETALRELLLHPAEGRSRHVIFLTDGVGAYDPTTLALARGSVRIHTVGLGGNVDDRLLSSIAAETGGRYYPVARAEDLIAVFEKIFSENLDLTQSRHGHRVDAEQLTHPSILYGLRILGWAVVGLALGFGQGIRENTREDLRACSLGGLLGGAVGGALFDPLTQALALGAGFVGRGVADVAVGAFIGGALRMAQTQLVQASGKPTTTLLSILPWGGSLRGARRATRPKKT